MHTYTLEFFLTTDDDDSIDCSNMWAALQAAGMVGRLVNSDHFYGMDKFGALVIETEQNRIHVSSIARAVTIELQSEITVSEGSRIAEIRAETSEYENEDDGDEDEDEQDEDSED